MSKETKRNQRSNARNIVKKYHKKKTPWNKEQFYKVFKELQPQIVICSEFIDMKTAIECRCLKDDFRWKMVPRVFVSEGNGCPKCARKSNGKRYSKAVQGKNDIATLYPQLVKVFKNKEDSLYYKPQSNKKIELMCPYCKVEKMIPIYSLVSRGFSCDVCGDGVSYPNKIGRMFVLQLPVENIKFEWHPAWLSGMRRYDIKFEFNQKEYVIEMDGHQHFVENVSFTRKKLAKIQSEDALKDQFCKDNNVKIFRIDCRNNTLEWIKEQILQSELNEMFDLTLIDWKKCEQYAANSLIVETAKLWNDGYDLLEISEQLKVSRDSIQHYIKTADNIGLVKYEKERGKKKGIEKNSRRVRWIDTGKEYINCKICADEIFKQTGIKVTVSGIRAAAAGICTHTKGLHFEFCDRQEKEYMMEKGISSIYCYDMSGKFVAEYNNIGEAAKVSGTTRKAIIDCCDAKTKKAGNHIWKYSYQAETGEDFIVDLTKRGKAVDCFSIEGEYIESFSSARVALRKYTTATDCGIGRCCKGKQGTSGGYRWRYSDDRS